MFYCKVHMMVHVMYLLVFTFILLCINIKKSSSIEKRSLHLYIKKSTSKIITIHGKAFGQSIQSTSSIHLHHHHGEVVFSTAMTGYVESLTDPSYAGQILVLTYPLIGNYMVPTNKSSNGDRHFCHKYLAFNGHQSLQIQVKALIIADLTINDNTLSTHWQSFLTLNEWLKSENIPGIYGVNTRALVKLIRDNGSLNGLLTMYGENNNNNIQIQEFFNRQQFIYANNNQNPFSASMISKTRSREISSK